MTSEIMNESSILGTLNVEDLKKPHLSKPHNRLLADTFYKAGLIESWGRGTIKIVNECAREGLKEPEFTMTDNYFSILFYRTAEKDVEKDVEKLSPRQREIVSFIKAEPNISAVNLAAKVGINLRNIQIHLKKLKNLKIIVRICPAKGGYWKIINE